MGVIMGLVWVRMAEGILGIRRMVLVGALERLDVGKKERKKFYGEEKK
jgi:hypothetical protein